VFTARQTFFMLPPPIGIGEGFMFSICPSVSACVRRSVLARYLTNQWTEFHQILTVDVV